MEDKVGFYKFTKSEFPYNNDEAILNITQKMVLYNDMVEILKYLKDVMEKECYPEDAKFIQSLLDRAEKLK